MVHDAIAFRYLPSVPVVTAGRNIFVRSAVLSRDVRQSNPHQLRSPPARFNRGWNVRRYKPLWSTSTRSAPRAHPPSSRNRLKAEQLARALAWRCHGPANVRIVSAASLRAPRISYRCACACMRITCDMNAQFLAISLANLSPSISGSAIFRAAEHSPRACWE